MNFKINKKNFAYILSKSRWIRSCVYVTLKAEKDILTIKASNGETSLTSRLEHVDVISEGEITINAHKLNEIVQKMPNEEISFETFGENWIRMICENSIFKFPGMAVSEGQDDIFDAETGFNINSKVLNEMITKVIGIAKNKSTSYSIGGIILLQKLEDDSTLRFVSTDGFRLAVIDRECTFSGCDEEFNQGIKLSVDGFIQVSKLCANVDETVEVKIHENRVCFSCNNTSLYLKQVIGSFPDFNEFLETDNSNYFIAEKKELFHSLRRSLVVNDKEYPVKFKASEGGKIAISVENNNKPVFSESIKAQSAGNSLNVSFKPEFLLDLLDVLPGGQVKLFYNPSLLSFDSDSYKYFFAPCR